MIEFVADDRSVIRDDAGGKAGSGALELAPSVEILEAQALSETTAALTALVDRAEAISEGAWAANTLKAYRWHWERFATWCAQHGAVCLPAHPTVVALYLTEWTMREEKGEGRAVSWPTLAQAVAAIAWAHEREGEALVVDLALKQLLRGLRRSLGVGPQRQAPALRPKDVTAIASACVKVPLTALRDQALLAVHTGGYTSAQLARVVRASTSGPVVRLVFSDGTTEQIKDARTAGVVAEYLDELSAMGAGTRAFVGMRSGKILKATMSRQGIDFCLDKALALAGITYQRGAVTPISDNRLSLALNAMQRPSVVCVRDRALLLMGFFGAFRRSELANLTLADITRVPQGLIVRLARSKTDQEGRGRTVAIPLGKKQLTCAVGAWEAWWRDLEASGAAVDPDTPAFRAVNRHGGIGDTPLAGQAISTALRTRAKAAGLSFADDVTGHSVRRGFVTSAAEAKVPAIDIIRTTGQTLGTVQRYIEAAEAWENNPLEALDL